MKPFKHISSHVIPLFLDNVDTDMIIPAQYLTKIDKAGYGKHVFKRLREQNPEFVWNQPQYAGAEILWLARILAVDLLESMLLGHF